MLSLYTGSNLKEVILIRSASSVVVFIDIHCFLISGNLTNPESSKGTVGIKYMFASNHLLCLHIK